VTRRFGHEVNLVAVGWSSFPVRRARQESERGRAAGVVGKKKLTSWSHSSAKGREGKGMPSWASVWAVVRAPAQPSKVEEKG
jgi:hypothetical protein